MGSTPCQTPANIADCPRAEAARTSQIPVIKTARRDRTGTLLDGSPSRGSCAPGPDPLAHPMKDAGAIAIEVVQLRHLDPAREEAASHDTRDRPDHRSDPVDPPRVQSPGDECGTEAARRIRAGPRDRGFERPHDGVEERRHGRSEPPQSGGPDEYAEPGDQPEGRENLAQHH